jgi:DNA-binding transcriptional MerR regulator
MQIGALAKKAGVNPRTIRYYEHIGVLPPAERTASGYRQYSDEDLERLAFIRNAQASGVMLDEIKEVLAFRDRGVSTRSGRRSSNSAVACNGRAGVPDTRGRGFP